MRDENEIDRSQELSDMEILRSFIPSWDNAALEPLLTSPQDGIQQPTWNKIRFDPGAYINLGANQGNGSSIRGIMVVDGVARYVFFPGSIDGTV